MKEEQSTEEQKTIKIIEDIAFQEKKKYDIKDSKELDFFMDLVNIALENYGDFVFEENKDYVSISKSLKYAYFFLKKVNPEYGHEFIKAYNNGDIKVDLSYTNNIGKYKIDENIQGYDLKRNSTIGPKMKINRKDNSKTIDLPVENTIYDAVGLVHEFIHYMTMNNSNLDSLGFFIETPSVASEYLFEEMYKDINGVYNGGSMNLKGIYTDALYAKIKLVLFRQIINDNEFNINKFFNCFTPNLYNYVINVLNDVLRCREIHVMSEYTYILGTILSFDAINDKETLNEIIKLLKTNPNQLNEYLKLEPTEDGTKLKEDIIKRQGTNFSKKVNERNQLIEERNENNRKIKTIK